MKLKYKVGDIVEWRERPKKDWDTIDEIIEIFEEVNFNYNKVYKYRLKVIESSNTSEYEVGYVDDLEAVTYDKHSKLSKKYKKIKEFETDLKDLIDE